MNGTNKHITMEMWSEAGSFDRIAKPGDTVDDEIAMHFLNCMPPLIYRSDYFQNSEPYDDGLTSDGKWLAPTYATFCKRDDKWAFLGNCFRGGNVDIPDVNL